MPYIPYRTSEVGDELLNSCIHYTVPPSCGRLKLSIHIHTWLYAMLLPLHTYPLSLSPSLPYMGEVSLSLSLCVCVCVCVCVCSSVVARFMYSIPPQSEGYRSNIQPPMYVHTNALCLDCQEPVYECMWHDTTYCCSHATILQLPCSHSLCHSGHILLPLTVG